MFDEMHERTQFTPFIFHPSNQTVYRDDSMPSTKHGDRGHLMQWTIPSHLAQKPNTNLLNVWNVLFTSATFASCVVQY